MAGGRQLEMPVVDSIFHLDIAFDWIFEGINIALFIVSTKVQVLFVWTLFNMQNSDQDWKISWKKKEREESYHLGGIGNGFVHLIPILNVLHCAVFLLLVSWFDSLVFVFLACMK